jgi:hypothetical protein
MHLTEGSSYQFDWTPALLQRALRTVPGRGGDAPLKLTLPVWFWFLLLAVILAPPALLGFGVIGPQAVYAYPFGLVAGGILVGAFFWIIQHHLVAGTRLSEPLPMQITIAPSGVSLATAHFRNEYTWQAVNRVGESKEGLLIWMHGLLIAIIPDDALPGDADRAALKRQIALWREATL